MNYIQALREQVGLSQEIFSDLIDCNRVLLCMAELDKRSLPDKSRLLFHHIDSAWGQYLASNPVQVPTNSPSATEFLQKKERTAKAALETCLLDDEALTKKIQAAENLRQFLEVLTQNPLPNEDPIGQMQVDNLKRKLPKKLDNLYFQQAQLRLQIAELRAAIDFIAKGTI